MGSGHSSPCIVGGSIFLTTYDETQKQLAVVCIDRSNGVTRWKRIVPTEQIEKGHPSFNPASSTPTCDGQRVVAYFGSFGLICFDVEGQELWQIRMPLAKSFAGNATSPAIVGDRVILYRGTYVDHFLLAVDKQSGKELWRVPQDAYGPREHITPLADFQPCSRVILSARHFPCLCFAVSEVRRRFGQHNLNTRREIKSDPRVKRKAEVTQPRLFSFYRQFYATVCVEAASLYLAGPASRASSTGRPGPAAPPRFPPKLSAVSDSHTVRVMTRLDLLNRSQPLHLPPP